MGLRKQFMNTFVFPTWACAAGFNNNNNNVYCRSNFAYFMQYSLVSSTSGRYNFAA